MDIALSWLPKALESAAAEGHVGAHAVVADLSGRDLCRWGYEVKIIHLGHAFVAASEDRSSLYLSLVLMPDLFITKLDELKLLRS